MKIINKLNLTCTKAIDKKSAKEALQALYIDNERTIGCDGFTMIEVTNPKNLEIKDHPCFDDNDATSEKLLAILPDKIQTTKSPLPVLDSTLLIHSQTESEISLTSYNLESKSVTQAKLINENYPNIDTIKPNESDYCEIYVNPVKLKAILEAVIEFSTDIPKKEHKKIKIQFNKNSTTAPIIITDKNMLTEQKFYSLLMPMRED